MKILLQTIAGVADACSKIAGTNVIYQLPDNVESKGFSKPQNCVLDNSKLKSLGWSGSFSLLEGLNETIDTLRRNNEC